MYISYLHLENFKRFTDLTIDLSKLDQPPKLVLLIGANGSGKSSVFDAFERISFMSKDGRSFSDTYYRKDKEQEFQIKAINPKHSLQPTDEFSHLPKTAFYGRSSLRQIPQLTSKKIEINVEADSDRPLRYTDRDNRFENDIEILTQKILEEVFKGTDFDSKKLKEKYLQPINNSLFRIFGGVEAPLLELISLKPPLAGKVADVRFKKGVSEIHYDLLSSGEKEVINILLNLFVRRDTYADTIYFIDELDLHLNTRLQYALLKEITENWIPDRCQLWTASHSFGFIEYAREAEHAAIIDFDGYDFDEKYTLLPEPKTSLDIFDVAVPKSSIFHLFDDKQIVLCENQNDQFYNLLRLENKLFVGVTDKNNVFMNMKNDPRYYGLMDRDFLTDQELTKAKKKYPNLHILTYYCFENYLYHPDNIAEIVEDFDTEAYQQEILRQKEAKKLKIIYEIKSARSSYKILNEPDSIKSKDEDSIIESLNSSRFEDFYKFFSMKEKSFNREFVAKYNLKKEALASTEWFKSQFKELL
ncbi:MAG: AAA family ATPase [Cyclobacteriaceae bacterium]